MTEQTLSFDYLKKPTNQIEEKYRREQYIDALMKRPKFQNQTRDSIIKLLKLNEERPHYLNDSSGELDLGSYIDYTCTEILPIIKIDPENSTNEKIFNIIKEYKNTEEIRYSVGIMPVVEKYAYKDIQSVPVEESFNYLKELKIMKASATQNVMYEIDDNSKIAKVIFDKSKWDQLKQDIKKYGDKYEMAIIIRKYEKRKPIDLLEYTDFDNAIKRKFSPKK